MSLGKSSSYRQVKLFRKIEKVKKYTPVILGFGFSETGGVKILCGSYLTKIFLN